MAEDRSEPREINWRQLLPWTILFQGFRVALDPHKLVLAAAGILAMAFGWWLLALLFNPGQKPAWPSDYRTRYPDNEMTAWARFKTDRQHWNLMHMAAGPSDSQEKVDAGDLAQTPQEYDVLSSISTTATIEDRKKVLNELARSGKLVQAQADLWSIKLGTVQPTGRLRTWPWFEDRGPNPYLLVTGQVQRPWEPGRFLNWILTEQVPVLVEPLVKMFRPVVYFFSSQAGFVARLYFLLVMVWTVSVWALFGGAIARIAAVQVTRQEKIKSIEAMRFAWQRCGSLVTAPLFPLLIVALIVIVMMIFGLFHMIPLVGDIVIDGLFWWVPILLGLAMAVVLVGLIGWPLMAATISTEGTDTWEAVSRSYSYVYQAPWNFIFYCAMALVYGAVVVFFVGFMGSFMVYLAKWGVSQGSWGSREPSYLFVYAPTSFQWQELLLKGGKVDGESLVDPNTDQLNRIAYNKLLGNPPSDYSGPDRMVWYNKIGAFLVSVWLYLLFLLILGFGYSYFWSASTIIYLLMRRKVDDAELDEVYLEEEDLDMPFGPTAAPAPAPPSGSQPLTMVEPPTLRTPPPGKEGATAGSSPPPPDTSTNPPPRGDGESPS